MDWLSSKLARQILMGLLISAALISVLRGAYNGFHASQDFQWIGARLILDHIDPWRDAINGDPLHRIISTQVPNYLPVLYIFLAPLALLTHFHAQVVWVVCNILFAIVSAWIAARFFGLGKFGIAATICALLAATPTRNTIGNGQQGLFILLFWSLGLLTLRLTNARSAVAGIGYLKYNFAPPLAIYLWLRSGIRSLLFSLLAAALGVVLVWLWLTGGHDVHMLGWLTIAPMKVSKLGYFPSGGSPNLMDVLETPLLAAHVPRPIVDTLTLCTALAVCIVLLYRVTRGKIPASVQCHMALLGVLSFGLFKHHSYDAVVLIFTLCYLARLRHQRVAQIALALLAYIWYVERAIDQFLPRIAPWSFIPQFAMLMIIAWLILKLRHTETPTFPPAAAKPA